MFSAKSFLCFHIPLVAFFVFVAWPIVLSVLPSFDPFIYFDDSAGPGVYPYSVNYDIVANCLWRALVYISAVGVVVFGYKFVRSSQGLMRKSKSRLFLGVSDFYLSLFHLVDVAISTFVSVYVSLLYFTYSSSAFFDEMFYPIIFLAIAFSILAFYSVRSLFQAIRV